jgi:phenylalanine-4-hydroxylase
VYFVLNSLDDLLALAHTDFAPFYDRLADAPHYTPGDVLAQDRLLCAGTGQYHRERQRTMRQSDC